MESFDNTHKETKKKYIFENIDKIKNHKNYLDIVEFHNCQHTKNSNGIFLNLNTLDDEVIDKIYYKLKNEIEDEALTENIIEKQIIEKEIETLLRESKGLVIEKNYDIIKLDDFKEEEREIIELSKKYKI
jgi:ABC-type phosphate transport system auxiliary subunit